MAKVTRPQNSGRGAKGTSPKATAPAQTAKPGTPDAAGTGKAKGRELYPGLVGPKDDDGNPTTVQLKEVPKDWDPQKHKGLRRKDFADDALFFDWRADRLELQAKGYRQQAEEFRKLGSVKDRARAKKLLSMQKRIEDLKQQLAGEGVNVNELLATISGGEDEK